MGKSETGVGGECCRVAYHLPMAYHRPWPIIAHGLSLPMAYHCPVAYHCVLGVIEPSSYGVV